MEQTAKNLNLDQLKEVSTNLLVNAAKTECDNQLNNQEGGVADLVLTPDQKANICDCVVNELKHNLNAQTLQNLTKEGNIDTSVITGMVTGAMATCTAPTEPKPSESQEAS